MQKQEDKTEESKLKAIQDKEKELEDKEKKLKEALKKREEKTSQKYIAKKNFIAGGQHFEIGQEVPKEILELEFNGIKKVDELKEKNLI